MNLSTRDLARIFSVSNQRVNAIFKSLDLKEPEVEMRGNTRYYAPVATRKILNYRNFSIDKKVIAVENLKGGVGKTTTVVNLAKFISSLGVRVVVLDTDKQGNTSAQFSEKEFEYVLYDVIKGDCSINDALITVNETLALLPSNLRNSRIEEALSGNTTKNPLTYFESIIRDIDAEVILVDTEPTLSMLNTYIMLGADLTVIPILLDRFSLEGLSMILDTISDLESNFPNKVINKKVLINKFDNRMKTSLEYFSQLNELGVDMLSTVIKTDTAFTNVQRNCEDLPKASNAFKDISALALEVIGLSNQEVLQ